MNWGEIVSNDANDFERCANGRAFVDFSYEFGVFKNKSVYPVNFTYIYRDFIVKACKEDKSRIQARRDARTDGYKLFAQTVSNLPVVTELLKHSNTILVRRASH